MRVLVVEDEERLSGLLRGGLAEEGFAVDVAPNGREGLWMATEHRYDAIVLDVMLPLLNGYAVCRRLREAGNWTPIMMLTDPVHVRDPEPVRGSAPAGAAGRRRTAASCEPRRSTWARSPRRRRCGRGGRTFG
jgi:CheY-like chemotaxis protein